MFNQTVIAENTLETLKMAAVQRTYSDGSVKYGVAKRRNGGKWELSFAGRSRCQVVRIVRYHKEMNGVLVWCG